MILILPLTCYSNYKFAPNSHNFLSLNTVTDDVLFLVWTTVTWLYKMSLTREAGWRTYENSLYHLCSVSINLKSFQWLNNLFWNNYTWVPTTQIVVCPFLRASALSVLSVWFTSGIHTPHPTPHSPVCSPVISVRLFSDHHIPNDSPHLTFESSSFPSLALLSSAVHITICHIIFHVLFVVPAPPGM